MACSNAIFEGASLLLSLQLSDTGPYGLDGSLTEALIRRHVMDSKSRHEHPFGSYTIFEGTSEVQRLVIARAVSGIHIP